MSTELFDTIKYSLFKILESDDDDANTNSVKFFIIYVPSQQLQGQLQTQHSVDTSTYIMEQYNIKTSYKQAMEEKTVMQRSK
jgi:hypothetical protein